MPICAKRERNGPANADQGIVSYRIFFLRWGREGNADACNRRMHMLVHPLGFCRL